MRTKLMTIVSVPRLACYASLLALVLASPVRAQSANTGAVSEKEVQAKLAYCEVCHGVAAQGFNGYYPIPRLAGQQIAYIENELQGFVEHKRTNNIMFNVGHVLSPAMIKALATDFHNLNPKPLGGGPKDLVPAGEKSFNRDCPMPAFRRAPPVTVRRPRAMISFRAWQASSIPIWWASCPIGPVSAARPIRTSWRRSHTT